MPGIRGSDAHSAPVRPLTVPYPLPYTSSAAGSARSHRQRSVVIPTNRHAQAQPQELQDSSPIDDLVQVIGTGRRSHKLCQSTKEAIWPVKLEAALINGLKAYAKSGACSRPAKRHPKRNRFLSEYISRETQTYRTPKQIGSRIQQLKETCPNPEIQRLINQIGNEDFDAPLSPTSPPNLRYDYDHGASPFATPTSATSLYLSRPSPPYPMNHGHNNNGNEFYHYGTEEIVYPSQSQPSYQTYAPSTSTPGLYFSASSAPSSLSRNFSPSGALFHRRHIDDDTGNGHGSNHDNNRINPDRFAIDYHRHD